MSATRGHIGKSLVLLAIASLLAACGEYAVPTSPAPDGKVKRQSVWLADVNTRAKLRLVSVIEFAENGNATNAVTYSEVDNSQQKSIYSYNDTVSMEEKIFLSNDGSVSRHEKFEYVYDVYGKMKNLRQYDKDGNIKSSVHYVYDQFGNVIKKQQTDYVSGKNTDVNITNKYGSNGSLSERIISDGSSNEVTRDSLNYADDHRSVEIINIDSQGKIEAISSFIYDRSGRVSERRESDAQGNILKIYVYEYEYYK